jgi:hypothetical protein
VRLSRARVPLSILKFIATLTGPGGRFVSPGMIVFATLTRNDCPDVMPTIPKDERSRSNPPDAFTDCGSRNMATAATSAKTNIPKIISVLFLFIFPLLFL